MMLTLYMCIYVYYIIQTGLITDLILKKSIFMESMICEIAVDNSRPLVFFQIFILPSSEKRNYKNVSIKFDGCDK